ncbi:MAG: acyltransferase family protein [Sphingobacteriales bacterium]
MSLTQRFTALDVFRGMTICLMIIVNTPGNGATTYAPLLHAKWHGFTPTDLVFPSFLFAVGNAMSFVMINWESKSNAYVVGKILKRTFLIFLLGYLMYWFPFFKLDKDLNILSFPIDQTRIMGVLQRIALCYGAAALMIHFLKIRTATIISIILLIGYWLVLLFFGEAGKEFTMTGNIGQKIDMWLMGEKHLYHGEGVAFDPEGWLSTLPAIGNVIVGYIAGKFIQKKGKTYETLTKLMVAGFVLLVIAYFWDLSFPINKKLWTSSFVLYTTGIDCIILSIIIYVIDFLHKTKWTNFFEIVGKNPLFVYLLSELLATVLWMIHTDKRTSLYQWIYHNIFSCAGAYFGSFLFAVAYMLLCWSVGYWLDKKKIYVRV